MVENGLEWLRVDKNGWEWFLMAMIGYIGMVETDSWCFRVGENGWEWLRVGKNGKEWFLMAMIGYIGMVENDKWWLRVGEIFCRSLKSRKTYTANIYIPITAEVHTKGCYLIWFTIGGYKLPMAPIITAKIWCTDKLHQFSSFITAYSSYSGNLV